MRESMTPTHDPIQLFNNERFDLFRSTCAPTHLHFKRGDADASGLVELTDAIVTLGHLFLGDPPSLTCRDAADSNDDGLLDVSDPVATLTHLFLGVFAIPAPGTQACGPDPVPENEGPNNLECDAYPPEACR